MIRSHHRARLPASIGALLSALAAAGCSSAAPGADELMLGSEAQALKGHHSKACQHGLSRRHPERCAETPPPPDPIAFTPGAAARRAERRAGVAVALEPLENEPVYGEIVAAEFTDVTPENDTKWGPLQPVSPHAWDFSRADEIVAFAAASDMAVKGHTFIWHQQLPSFITDTTKPKLLRKYARHHIRQTAHHFRGDVYGWDVVNEAIADDGSLRVTPFSSAFGEEYIDRAFRRAHSADRNAKLYYNDYGIEGFGPKSDAALALMTRLLERDVPVDGIGFQAHFDARFVPSVEELVANFQRFADLGLSVNVSELDVRVARLGGTRAYQRAVQKQIYQRVAAACVQVEACEGVTTWGFTDAHSWVDSTFGADDPLLFDDSYQKKPAYYGYVDGFLGVPLDSDSDPNLIGNSSLEAGLDGWSPMGSAPLASEVALAHTGLRSARAGGRTASWQGPRHDVTALVQAARGYDVSVWTRVSGAASAPVRLTAQISCPGQDAVFQPIASATATDTGWTELSGSLTLPDCALGSVAVYMEGPDAGIDVLADDLALREQPQPNLITNADFETGAGGWFGWGPTVVSTTTDAHGGDLAAIGSGRTANWNGVATDLTSRVVRNGSYRASAWIKLAGAASDSAVLTAAVTCAGGAQQFLRVGSATATNSGWTEVTGTVTVPSCNVQNFVLYAEGPAAGVDLLVDDIAFWQTAVGQEPNVITNPGFETDASGWFAFGPVSVQTSTERAHEGSRSGHVSGRTANWQGLATSLVGRLEPGASYSVHAWAQVGSGTSGVNLTFQNACTDGATNFTFVAGATASAGAWAELQGTLVAPNCTLGTGNLYIEGAPAGVDIYLDDVEVRRLP